MRTIGNGEEGMNTCMGKIGADENSEMRNKAIGRQGKGREPPKRTNMLCQAPDRPPVPIIPTGILSFPRFPADDPCPRLVPQLKICGFSGHCASG
jgi:hypothetical protein